MFPDLFKTAGELITPERLVRITGTIDRGDKGTKVRGTKIEPLADVQTQTIKRIHIRLAACPEAKDQLPRLLDVFKRHPGAPRSPSLFGRMACWKPKRLPFPT